MSSWFTRAFGYGLGAWAGRALFGAEGREESHSEADRPPPRQQTEAEILAAEKQYDEDEKKLDAADAARAAAERSGAGKRAS